MKDACHVPPCAQVKRHPHRGDVLDVEGGRKMLDRLLRAAPRCAASPFSPRAPIARVWPGAQNLRRRAQPTPADAKNLDEAFG
jgi:hypothetical protein